MNKLERIEQKKKEGYSRNNRRLKNYSSGFIEIFNFFLKSYRKGILDFCGSIVKVEYKENSSDGMFGFREYDNGRYKNIDIIHCSHPNILKGIIIGKKSWGLFVNEWCDGIVEGSFTKYEILKQFEDNEIIIPNSLKEDFENRLRQKRIKYYEKIK